jgi:hypothetical protein
MTERFDFERYWLAKLGHCLEEMAGAAVRDEILAGSEGLSTDSDPQSVLDWTAAAMARLDWLVNETMRREIMTGCACQYPTEALQEIKQGYAETGDLAAAHHRLQEQFEAFLRENLKLEEALVEEVMARGWGLAGVLEGDRILATKIPKSGNLKAYLEETDPERKRQLYCHCPRVRQALQQDVTISPTYCYCGAGFYQGIWGEITGRPVQVELLESVLAGGEVCRVAITVA